MRKQRPVGHLIYNPLSKEVEGFDSLVELALDMRWSWNHATDKVWSQLDPLLWEVTRNPWGVLQTVSREQVERVLEDPVFRRNVDVLIKTRRQALEAPAWFQLNHSNSALTTTCNWSREWTFGSTRRDGLGRPAERAA
jgi:glycogen phosphorylase